MEDWENDAIEQVIAASIPDFMNTKIELADYFKKEYPANWQKTLSTELSFINGKSTPANIARRFRGTRLNTPTRIKAEKSEYETLGKQLPPKGYKPPKNGYHVHFRGYIRFSECEYRDFHIDIKGEAAKELAEAPETIVTIMTRVYMQYPKGADDELPGICEEEGEPTVTITANPDDKELEEPKQHKPALVNPFFKKRREELRGE